MKKILIIFVFFVLGCLNIAFGQILTIYTSDTSFNRLDSIQIGFHPDATMGVDTALGEIAILEGDTSFQGMLKVIQRSALDWNCLYGEDENATPIYQPVYFETSFDSKVNVRPSFVDSVQEQIYFEIEVLDSNYAFLSFSTVDLFPNNDPQSSDPLKGSFSAYKKGTECPGYLMTFNNWVEQYQTPVILKNFYSYNDLTGEAWRYYYFTIIPDTYPPYNTGTRSKELKKGKDQLKIAPNPVNNSFYLENYQPSAATQMTIYNQLGQQVQQKQLTSNEVDASHLRAGIYYYSITEDGEMKYTGRFVKQ